MNNRISNYTVIIEKQQRIGTKKSCYMGFVPILNIATEEDTLEKIQKEIKALITFHIECLAQEGEEIPVEGKESLITKFETVLPKVAA